MQKLLDEITTSPGAIGSCVYSTEHGILASNLPDIFHNDTQNQISSLLHQIFKLNAAVKLNVNAYEIQYDEALILVKHLCDASSFIVICEPDANTQRVNMAISVLSAKMIPLLNECKGQQTETQEQETATPPEQAEEIQGPVDTNTVINDLLADEMILIRKALAKCIGPIAAITLKEEVEAWLEAGAPHRDRLAELAHSLLSEIDDEAAQNQFMDDLKSLL